MNIAAMNPKALTESGWKPLALKWKIKDNEDRLESQIRQIATNYQKIAVQMDHVLSGRADVRTAIAALMLRPQRAEAETG